MTAEPSSTAFDNTSDVPIKHEYCVVFKKPAGQAPPRAERCLKAPEVNEDGGA